MVAARKQPFITPEAYLKREREAVTKSEYINGQIYAMSGASRQHNRITVNIIALLHSQLRSGPCEPFAVDMRVKVSIANMYTYPDVAITCDEARFEDVELDTLLNPTLILEILSDSTEKYDRGRKFASYQEIASLQEYVLVSQSEARIECFTRQSDGRWILTIAGTLESVMPLESIGCALPLSDVYARVSFDIDEAEEPAEGVEREV